MEYSLNEQGQLVDADGNVVEIGGEHVSVKGVVTQSAMEAAITKRLNQQKERIKTLESQATKTPELERLLEQERAEKSRIESELADAKRDAEQKVASQVAAATKKAEKLALELETEKAARVRDQVSTLILGAAKDQFNDPAIDVVPHLLNAHKREPKLENGKPVDGQFVDVFSLTYKNDAGETVTESVPVDKALEIWAGAHPHHVRASNSGGSGGGSYGPQQGSNPWAKDTWNVTQQHALIAKDRAKAVAMARAAGVNLPGA